MLVGYFQVTNKLTFVQQNLSDEQNKSQIYVSSNQVNLSEDSMLSRFTPYNRVNITEGRGRKEEEKRRIEKKRKRTVGVMTVTSPPLPL
jgi:hypothetical protein